jgi:hypothetical protein
VRLLRAVMALMLGLLVLAPAVAPAQDPAPAAELSAIGQAAAQRGIRTCLPKIDRLATGLAASYDIGVFFFNQLDRPDEGLVSISMELTPSPSNGPVYLSGTFVPVAGSECQVMVETTIHWASNCAAVGIAYPGYQLVGQLLRDVRILASQGSERLFLMPAGPAGCISIEKTVYF